jgi:hypothetical protein
MNSVQSLFKLNDDLIIQSLLLLDLKDIGTFMQVSVQAEKLGNQTFSLLWYDYLGWNHLPYMLRCLENFKQNWLPNMTRMPINYTWMIVGMATCFQCKAVSFDTADHNVDLVTVKSTNLLMCEQCPRIRTGEDCTTIWDDEKKTYKTAACADGCMYGLCCYKNKCTELCVWKCHECDVEVDTNDLVAVEIETNNGQRITKRILCTACHKQYYAGCKEIDRILWWGMSIEEHNERYNY